MGRGENYFQAQKYGHNYALLSHLKPGQRRRLLRKLLEERQFVVDSRASMHMLSKKDLSSAEIDTLWRSRIPTTVVTANGEVQTNEEAQVYVHDLGLFVTVQLLEDTLAVLSFGKLFEEHGYSYERTSGQRPQLKTREGNYIQNGQLRTLCFFQGCLSVLVLLF